MDVFKLDQSIGGALAQPARAPTPEVSFDAGSEFNLSFFDAPEDSAHSCFSDPDSAGSASPPPALSASVPPPLQIAEATTPPTIVHCSNNLTTIKQEPQGSAAQQTQQLHQQQQNQQLYVAADSASSATGNKAFVPCKVCGDKASGYHYGVTSCEGCKGFFRRSIQKQIEYRCLRDGKCLVIRLNRNRCQFCRFKKCLAVGMSRDSVRYGRVPKRSRERERGIADENGAASGGGGASEVAEAIASRGQLPVASLLGHDSELPSRVLVAFRTHCAIGDDRSVERKPVPAPSPPADTVSCQRVWLWQQLAVRLSSVVPRIVEFAKQLPGFTNLGQDDQIILIKMGFFEIWLTHAAHLATESTLSFDDGAYLTRQQLEIMYDVTFASSVLHATSSLNALPLNETELALFSAAVLLSPERKGVTDMKTIQHNQDKIIEALKLQISQNHINSSEVGSSLTVLLAELQSIGVQHAVLLDWFRANWVNLRVPPLFAELFDIPKCDDDFHLD